MDNCLETEVLIIGCGIAGGTAALQLADAGIPVTVITRSRQPEESNTLYAQGGIIYEGEGDSPELLAEDIVRAGAGFLPERCCLVDRTILLADRRLGRGMSCLVTAVAVLDIVARIVVVLVEIPS